jgi:hypothetical protein
MKNEKNRVILLWVIIIVLFMFANKAPTFSVADIEGNDCTADDECPCWGEYTEGGERAYGIGVGKCVNSTCDMSYCIDVEPVKEWARENPFAYFKENPGFFIVVIGLLLIVIAWPKI